MSASDSSSRANDTNMQRGVQGSLRVGLGADAHALVEGRKLVLGGVRIAHPRGLDGHSDADVLVHAIMDALLGALRLDGANDIGELFPDSDPIFAGVSSLSLLVRVGELVNSQGYIVVDIDSVIIAQEPRITPYRTAMRESIAAALNIAVQSVGVKATTTEHLGFEGRQEGISATAVVLLQKVLLQEVHGKSCAEGITDAR